MQPPWDGDLSPSRFSSAAIPVSNCRSRRIDSWVMKLNLARISVACLLAVATTACSAQASPAQQSAYREHVQKAGVYLREKRPDLAIPELQAAVSIEPGNPDTQANLGVLLFFQGKPADAIPHLRAAVQAEPSLAKIQGLLGIAELHTGDISGGRSDLAAAFPQIADSSFRVQAGLELVSSWTETGDLDQAAAILTQLERFAPDNPEVLYAAYRTFADLSGEARLQLSVTAPDSAQTHQMLAHEDLLEGKTNAAIEQYRKAIAIDPRLPDVHYELGDLLNTAADPAIRKEAVQEFHIALQQNPYNEQALCSLALIALQNGDAQQAMQEYSQAIHLQPSDAGAHLGLAKAFMYLNEKSKALPEIEEAVRLEPTDPVAHYRLALLDREAGRDADAKREMDLFTQYKAMKSKLRALYAGLLIQPKEIQPDDLDGK